MADSDPKLEPVTFKGAIMTMNPKIVLAFFLVIVSASLLVFFSYLLVGSKGSIDAGTAAMIATMVTTFILMAKSACDYQTSSSAGSDKKDDAQTAVSKALAEKVPTPPTVTPPPVAPVAVVVAWWSLLTDPERKEIATSAGTDPDVAAFMAAAQTGAATTAQLSDLVTKGLLTQARADALSAA